MQELAMSIGEFWDLGTWGGEQLNNPSRTFKDGFDGTHKSLQGASCTIKIFSESRILMPEMTCPKGVPDLQSTGSELWFTPT
jgi:hypothetical protein